MSPDGQLYLDGLGDRPGNSGGPALPRRGAGARAAAGHENRRRDSEASPAGDGTAGLDAHVAAAFARGAGHGLLQLGAAEVQEDLPPSLRFYRELAMRYLSALCRDPDLEDRRERTAVPAISANVLADLAIAAPPMIGIEYVDVTRLYALWLDMHRAFCDEIAACDTTVEDFLRRKNPVWTSVGRVCLHLAENKDDPDHPFAFLATYTTRMARGNRLRHRPLFEIVSESSSRADPEALRALLVPIRRAARSSAFIAGLVESGQLFRSMKWTASQARRFLDQVSVMEAAGVIVRVPDWWRERKRLSVSVTLGGQAPLALGYDAMLDFSVSVTLDGEPLSDDELRVLMKQDPGLASLRGHWVELDRERLGEVLDHWREVERAVREGGVSFHEAMRLMAGSSRELERGDDADAIYHMTEVKAGDWLASVLAGLRDPANRREVSPGRGFRAILRPYQAVGVRWLHFAVSLGIGVCLADDMGLGKTIQVLGLLMAMKRQRQGRKGPHLLVAPASLLANWLAEITRFAPSLVTLVAHPSAISSAELAELATSQRSRIHDSNLVMTSYGTLHRLPWMAEIDWDLVILDEAQAIKNPGTKQTRACKSLRSRGRIALTGTPVENRLGDLWSLFDFLDPGLLGPAATFRRYAKALASRNDYAPLRKLIAPYILRRLKTDDDIARDLPEKTEVRAYCGLSKKQAALYRASVDQLARELALAASAEGSSMKRRGLVLSFLLRFKQICNHPSQWLSDGRYQPAHSGKFQRVRELCQTIEDKREKVLVFTQFREITEPLGEFLEDVFGRPGVVLHGQTRVSRRKELVDRFQNDPRVPYFVISVKAGGTGLNLTAASHVIHFDRWWNPAVENQATDRAYRLGQTRNVLVHKLICRGTIEERIDAMIAEKQSLSRELLDSGGDVLLTELSDDQLLDAVTLDIDKAVGQLT